MEEFAKYVADPSTSNLTDALANTLNSISLSVATYPNHAARTLQYYNFAIEDYITTTNYTLRVIRQFTSLDDQFPGDPRVVEGLCQRPLLGCWQWVFVRLFFPMTFRVATWV